MSESQQGGTGAPVDVRKERRLEIFAFLFLTGIVLPGATVAVVGGYGFIVWIYQMIVGPPGAPL